jgi:outer membrane biogenesis lipoprotein LolB
MKTLKYTIALLVCLLLGACHSFIAPRDPVSGVRQDAPDTWEGTPDPRDAAQTNMPRPEAMGRFSAHEQHYRESY